MAITSRSKVRPIAPISPRSAAAASSTGIFSIVDRISAFQGLMRASDLAEIFGISEDALYRLIRRKRDALPRFILPGCSVMMFDPATVVFYLRKHNPILNQVQKAS